MLVWKYLSVDIYFIFFYYGRLSASNEIVERNITQFALVYA